MWEPNPHANCPKGNRIFQDSAFETIENERKLFCSLLLPPFIPRALNSASGKTVGFRKKNHYLSLPEV